MKSTNFQSNTLLLYLSFIILTLSFSFKTLAVEPYAIKTDKHQTLIWQPTSSSWLSVENFWHNYASNKNTVYWQKSATYPEYKKVKEGDTFLVELKQGQCLMEFYHSRWRRANDVRRWNDQLNQHSACAYVFD